MRRQGAELRTPEFYRENARALGRVFETSGAGKMNRASTDIGNVLQVVPAIHPYIGLNSLPATNHQPEFAQHCVGPDASRAIRDAAVALAQTIVDFVG